MSNVERRLELAFDFIGEMLANPSQLEKLPDRAAIGLGDEADPELTAESAALLQKADLPKGLPRGLLARRSVSVKADASTTYQPIEA